MCCSAAVEHCSGMLGSTGIPEFKSNCDTVTWRDHMEWGHLPRISIPLLFKILIHCSVFIFSMYLTCL